LEVGADVSTAYADMQNRIGTVDSTGSALQKMYELQAGT